VKVERKRRRWKWVLTALMLFALAGTVFVFLPSFLIVPAQTAHADVILHYATASRRTHADDLVAQLYQQKVASKIICISRNESCGVYPADDSRRRLLALGIPAEDVLTLHLPRAECVAPALPRIVEIVKANGWHQALLVVSPSRSRSTGNIAKKYFQQAGLQLTVTYSPQAYQEATTRWWSSHQKAQNITEALISNVLDPLYSECR
jgi:uncharacterized SAM-binding protein YcdF (DUF218 family)